jgi:hypothetical protein
MTMKFGNRFLSGASALAAAARELIDDDTSGGAAAAGAAGPEDEEEEPDPPAAAAAPAQAPAAAAPAAAAPPAAPAAGAEAPARELSAEEQTIFADGAEFRDNELAQVFSAKVGETDELVVAGREQAAVELFCAGLSAEQTIKTLGKLPKGSSGDAMLEALRAQSERMPTSQPSGGEADNAPKSVWDRAHARLGWADKDKGKGK